MKHVPKTKQQAREAMALAFLKDFVRETRELDNPDGEVPGADAVDYLVALRDRAEEILHHG